MLGEEAPRMQEFGTRSRMNSATARRRSAGAALATGEA